MVQNWLFSHFFYILFSLWATGLWCNDPSSPLSPFKTPSLHFPFPFLPVKHFKIKIYPTCLSPLRKLSIVYVIGLWLPSSTFRPGPLSPSISALHIALLPETSSVLTSSTVTSARLSLPLSSLLWVSSWSADVVLISWSTSYWQFWDGFPVSSTPCMCLFDESAISCNSCWPYYSYIIFKY